MTNSERYYKTIVKVLSAFESEIKIESKSNLHDINIFAENITKKLFNILFDFSLENANSINFNQVGFDLIDTNKKVLIQVSSTNTAEKISTSINSCAQKYSGYEYYFFGLFTDEIKKETKKYKYFNNANISVKKDNLLNFSSIGKKIQNAELIQIKEISNYFDSQFNYYNKPKLKIFKKLEDSYLIFLEDFFSNCSTNFWLNYSDYSQVNVIPQNYVEEFNKISLSLFSQNFKYKDYSISRTINKLIYQMKLYQLLFSKKMVIEPNSYFYREDKSWKSFAYKTGQNHFYEKQSDEWNCQIYNIICNITYLLNTLLNKANKRFKYNSFPQSAYLIGDSHGIRNNQTPCFYKPNMLINYTRDWKITFFSKIRLWFNKRKFYKEYSL